MIDHFDIHLLKAFLKFDSDSVWENMLMVGKKVVSLIGSCCLGCLRVEEWKSWLIWEVVMNTGSNHTLQITRVQPLQSKTLSGSLKWNMKKWLRLCPVGCQDWTNLWTYFRSSAGQETCLGNNGLKNMILHLGSLLLTTENLAEDVTRFSCIVNTLRSEDGSEKNTEGRAGVVSSDMLRYDDCTMVEQSSGETETEVLVDQTVGEQRPATLVPVTRISSSSYQHLRHLSTLIIQSLLQYVSDKSERSVSMVVWRVDDQVVLLVSGEVPGVQHMLDKLDNVSHLARSLHHQVENTLRTLCFGLETWDQGGGVQSVSLTMLIHRRYISSCSSWRLVWHHSWIRGCWTGVSVIIEPMI